MSRRCGDRGAMRAVDTRDLSEQRSLVLVDHHQAILARDEDPMVGRIGYNVIPASFAAEHVGVGDPILG